MGLEPARRRPRRLTGTPLAALVITLVVAAVAPLFVASYSLALADPVPREVPIGTVGTQAFAEQVESALNGGTAADAADSTFQVQAFADQKAAEAALEHQRIYAIIGPEGNPTPVVVSSASGASVAQLVEREQTTVATALGTDVQLSDAHPLAPRDPSGLVVFYLALAATVLGFVGTVQTRVNAPGMTLRAELGWDAVRSLVVALALTVVIGPILGLETFPLAPAWLLVAAVMFIAAMVYSFWRVVVGGKWALLPTWITFVVVANPASGGAIARQELPAFYEAIGRFMPTGAAVQSLRDVTYFPGALAPEPFVVLAVWLVVATLAFVAVRLHRYGPGPIETDSPTAAPVVAVDSATHESSGMGRG